jgi:betaine-homocysteine S-methyltransferase
MRVSEREEMALGSNKKKPGLLERLEQGPVICAEGYLFECERRGYLQAGAFVPEAVLEHPEVVAELHRDFVHAGSDVVEAFTYYGHREKLRVIGKEDLLEPLNRQALRLAKEAADLGGALFAGDISNTNVFTPTDEARRMIRAMFEEQVGWAVEAGVDYVIAETISWGEEALIALEVIKAAGLPAVVTLAMHREAETFEGWPVEEACRRLEAAGADALPVPYRTTEAEPTFFGLTDPGWDAVPGGRAFPTALDSLMCNRYEIAEFGRRVHDLGVRYLGVCCGAGPQHIRSLAEALGRTPPASRYSPDMTKHAFLGTDPSISQEYRELAERL